MRVFVTVGSTHFDSLVSAALQQNTLKALFSKGYTELIVQCGQSKLDLFPSHSSDNRYTSDGVSIHLWRYKPSLREDFEKSDLVISHAGSGTILEVLRIPRPLIAVSNPTLLHNHQQELAGALQYESFLKAATVETLTSVILDLNVREISSFPAHDNSKFQNLIDEEMGYS